MGGETLRREERALPAVLRPASAPVHRGPARPGDPSHASLIELQRTAGNAAVVSLIAPRPRSVQRARNLKASHVLDPADEPDVPTSAETTELEQEWGELDARKQEAAKAGTAFAPADAARLKEVNRLIHLRQKKDAAVTLEGNGYKDGPAKWYGDVGSVKFLGRSVRVHKLLADRLAIAETAFLEAVKDQEEPEGGWVRSTSSLREAGKGLHGFGLAIDLNPGTNPWLINPSGHSERSTGEPRERSQAIRDIIDRAVLLVLGRTASEMDFGAQPDIENAEERVKASYDKLSEASGALRTYFTLRTKDNRAELERLVAELGDRDPKKRTVKAWLKAIRADRRSLGGMARRKAWSKPTQGFLDLPYELVKAMTGAGLTWLGDVVVGSGRDIMHFDMRGLGPIKRIYKSKTGSWTGLGG